MIFKSAKKSLFIFPISPTSLCYGDRVPCKYLKITGFMPEFEAGHRKKTGKKGKEGKEGKEGNNILPSGETVS
jgi:hypothetical protein